VEKHPALIEMLKQKHAFYIDVHMSDEGGDGAEDQHFKSALAGANRALEYYAGSVKDPEKVRGWIMEGIEHAASVQSAFMEGLLD
jgi:hypothetical protein